LCLPRSGPAVTGAGDFVDTWSEAGKSMPLLAKEGYADLFCFSDGPSSAVSTRREPGGGRLNWKPFAGLISTGEPLPGSWFRLAEIRASSEMDASLGSLLVLKERVRPSGCDDGGPASVADVVPVAAVAPDVGSSV
jgi:hypothetical protein